MSIDTVFFIQNSLKLFVTLRWQNETEKTFLLFILFCCLLHVTVTNGLFSCSLADNFQCPISDIENAVSERSHYSVISAIFCRTSIFVTYGKCMIIAIIVTCDAKITGLRICIYSNVKMHSNLSELIPFHSSSNIVIIQVIIFRIIETLFILRIFIQDN